MNNKYQIALNKIIRSCCPHCHDDNGCQNCEIKQVCNAIAKDWVDTLQKLIDKETPLKVDKDDYELEDRTAYDYFPVYVHLYKCPNTKCKLHNGYYLSVEDERCPECNQLLDWSDINE